MHLKKIGLAWAAGSLSLAASPAQAFDEAGVKAYFATGRSFACSIENYGVLSSQDSEGSSARVNIQSGGIGVILLVDLVTNDAGARYRFGSKIEIYSNVANFDVYGSPRERTGRLSSGGDWPFLKGEFALSGGSMGSLHGVLKNNSGDSLELYCAEE